MARTVIYSHGFGVRKDDRGLFTDIARAMPGVENILFDYNSYDDAEQILTVPSIAQQAEHFGRVIEGAKAAHADVQLDLICHSQGCVVAALLKPEGIGRVIFTAPPMEITKDRIVKLFGNRRGSEVNFEGVTRFARRDGSTTLISPDYWKSIEDLELNSLYGEFASITDLTIITASEDEILGPTDFKDMSGRAKVIKIEGDHNFTGTSRQAVCNVIKEVIA